ncbi:hypothetical protein A4A49_65891, partial [Nicotiana attenuata]
MLINEENQRRVFETNSYINVTNEVNDSTALISFRDNPPKFRFNNLYCEYCRNKGHTKKTCYKLAGYPSGFKGKRPQQYRQANMVVSDNNSGKGVAANEDNADKNLADFWIVDTGATDHMASNSEMLKTMTGLPNSKRGNMNLPNGKTIPVICKGSYNLINNDVIHDVLCVPDFKYNLLSLSKLTKELQCSVNFFPTFCVF